MEIEKNLDWEKLKGIVGPWKGKPPTQMELADAYRPPHRNDFYAWLEQLRVEGCLVRTRKDGWVLLEQTGMAVGRLQRNPRGFAFLVQDDPALDDLFIPPGAQGGALHGDRVLVTLQQGRRGNGERTEGSVVDVLQRARTRIVGVYESDATGGRVVPDNQRLGMDVWILPGSQGQAKPGMKVVAEITRWPQDGKSLAGRVVEVLGPVGDVGVDILAIARDLGLPEDFTPAVLAEVKKVPDRVEESAVSGRLDLRGDVVFTIDGADSKDFDDAVSVTPLPCGAWRLGVHIADVASYVRPGSALDAEAYDRGNSIYLIDRVIPMLPEPLSNGICSLNPRVDRLTLSCVMDIDGSGGVTRFDVSKSVIHSAARLTYDQVNHMLDAAPGSDPSLAAVEPSLRAMADLAAVLHAMRSRRGCLELDIDEPHIELDETGKPTHISPRKRGTAHKMIEEFMLCANETVALWLTDLQMPGAYRVHEPPNPEKMKEFLRFAQGLGYTVTFSPEKVRSQDLQQLLNQSQNRPEEDILNRVMLRSLQKARYSPQDTGHFGLAAGHYCHFTSPIRRYADLFMHRIIHGVLDGAVTGEWMRRLAAQAPKVSVQASERELVAQEAERAVDDMKMAEYMSYHIGEEFDGVVSGVTDFGIFVELPSTVEGLIRMSDLDDDYYVYDESQYRLVGSRTGKVYRLGDKIRVICASADASSRRVGFTLVKDR